MNTITIYDDITPATTLAVRTALARNPTAPVTVRINSPGGSPIEATTIHNLLQAHRGTVRLVVESFAASAAILICCAGYCTAPLNAFFMIHGAWTRDGGSARRLRESADIVEKISDGMARIIAAKTHRPLTEMRRLLSDGEDHWYIADEALAMGLINEVTPELAIAARLGSLQLPERFHNMTDLNAKITTDAITAERQRISAISQLFTTARTGRYPAPEIVALENELIDSGASVHEARERILAKIGAAHEPLGTGQGFVGGYAAQTPVILPDGPLTRGFYASQRSFVGDPIPYGGHGHSDFIAATADSLAQRMGARLEEVHPAARDFQGVSLSSLAALALQANGHNPVGLTGAALFQAAHTSSDFSVLLQEAGNRTLVSRYEQLVQDHRELCEIGDAPNFKTQKAVNISAHSGLALKQEAGEIQYGSMQEGAESYQVVTYAKGFSFSREAQINDDLDAIGAMLRTAANAAARLERDLVFRVLTANGLMSDGKALFHADHGNLDTSAVGINVTGLGKARALMRKQQDSSGGFILTTPRFIVCPVALESDAEALVGSLSYRPDLVGEMQTPPWVKSLRIVADPRLDVSDAADWFLLSEPGTAPVIRLAFLNGQQAPVIEQEIDFNRDITKFKVRLDVAACAVGFAGAVKMA